VGHGAVVTSKKAQWALMWPAFAIFVLSPTLWRVWHNKVHHGHTNRDDYDPDNFGSPSTYRQYRSVRLVTALTPGSGRWPSLLYIPIWFTVHTQMVLWRQSLRCRGFASLNRTRAVAETAATALFWVGLALRIGLWPSLLAIIIPMLLANASVMSYVVTNHFLRPLADDGDQLATTMSVTTHRWLDLVHFHFSHHAEHHLFPAMSSKYFPLVRASLRRHAGDRYLAPPHWRALRMVFGTPRFHDPRDVLVDPASGRAMPITDVTEALRADAA
jgi:fatty acid desaturase